MAQIDYSILTRPVQRSEIISFRSSPRYKEFVDKELKLVGGTIITFVVLLLLLPVIMTFFAAGLPAEILIGYIFLMPVLAVGGGLYAKRDADKRELRRYRQIMFADINGMNLIKSINDPQHLGMIFQDGLMKKSSDIYADNDDVPFEVGNYEFTLGEGRSSSTYNWGYICIGLKNELPNMVLDGKQNNKLLGVTNLPNLLRRDQSLSLEGDFNKYFTLYAPKTYENDALYIFTPDLMALMIDAAAPYDAEIIGNRLYIYSSKQSNIIDPITLKRIFTIIDLVGKKTRSRSQNYNDDQTPRNTAEVAAHGRQLRNWFSLRKVLYAFGIFITAIPAIIIGIFLLLAEIYKW